jgi:hypothetical protein
MAPPSRHPQFPRRKMGGPAHSAFKNPPISSVKDAWTRTPGHTALSPALMRGCGPPVGYLKTGSYRAPFERLEQLCEQRLRVPRIPQITRRKIPERGHQYSHPAAQPIQKRRLNHHKIPCEIGLSCPCTTLSTVTPAWSRSARSSRSRRSERSDRVNILSVHESW